MTGGVIPVKKVAATFIPYNLRKGFGMATTEHQDSIYAYYFYRMISRAKRVFLLYDSRTDGLKSGESEPIYIPTEIPLPHTHTRNTDQLRHSDLLSDNNLHR